MILYVYGPETEHKDVAPLTVVASNLTEQQLT